MNLIDLVVTEVLDKPFARHNKWWVKVRAEAYGVVSEHCIMTDSEEEAETIKKGFVFQG